MLKETIRAKLVESIKSKDEITKGILRVVLGEIETQESRKGQMTDQTCEKIIRTTIQGLDEMLKYKPDDKVLSEEKSILSAFIPKTMLLKDIEDLLNHEFNKPALLEAKSDNQAMSAAMSFLKKTGMYVDGNLAKEVVHKLRKEAFSSAN